MQPNVPSTDLGHTPEMTPAGMVYYGKCATDQVQRCGMKQECWPIYRPILSTSLGNRTWDAGGVSFEH